MGERRYGINLPVFNSIAHEWAQWTDDRSRSNRCKVFWTADKRLVNGKPFENGRFPVVGHNLRAHDCKYRRTGDQAGRTDGCLRRMDDQAGRTGWCFRERMTKPFERADVFDERMIKPVERMDVSIERMTEAVQTDANFSERLTNG